MDREPVVADRAGGVVERSPALEARRSAEAGDGAPAGHHATSGAATSRAARGAVGAAFWRLRVGACRVEATRRAGASRRGADMIHRSHNPQISGAAAVPPGVARGRIARPRGEHLRRCAGRSSPPVCSPAPWRLPACGSSKSSSELGSESLSTAQTKAAIEDSILKERHIHATVTCPAEVIKEKGVTFQCLAVTSSGARTTFHVIEVNGRGGRQVLLAPGAPADASNSARGARRPAPDRARSRPRPTAVRRTISIQSSSLPHSRRPSAGATSISARGGVTVGSSAIADR